LTCTLPTYTHDYIANTKRDGQETVTPVTCHLSLVNTQLLEQHDCSIDSPFHESYRVSYFSCAVTELTECGYATHTLFPAKPSIRGATERMLRGSVQTRKQHEHGITPTSPSLETRIVERKNKVSHPSHPGSSCAPLRTPAPPLASMLHPTLNTPTPHHDPIHTHTPNVQYLPTSNHDPIPTSPLHTHASTNATARRLNSRKEQPALPKAVSRSGAG
jgi:hypothetical protein